MEITNRPQYYLAMAELENLIEKGDENLSPAEVEYYQNLAKAVEAWELKENPMPYMPSIKDIIFYIMRQRDLTQQELAGLLQVSNSGLSEILNGKKKPNLELAKQLHYKFQVDGNLLLESV